MTKGMHKKSSKRQNLKTKYKIEKKVREHNRRLRKEGKKLKALGVVKKRSSFENKIPNSYPFKDKVIAEYEKKRDQRLKEMMEQKKNKKKQGKIQDEEEEKSEQANENPAFVKEIKYEKKKYVDLDKKHKKYAGQVIQASQIILHILDARDPASTRDKDTETKILSLPEGKKLILVLTKTDLVSKEHLDQWVKVLEQEFDTFVFDPKNPQALIDYVKQYTNEKADTVGIIGYPFVGKASIIRKLKEQVDADVKQQVSKMKNTFELVEGLRMVEYTGLIVPKDDDVTQCVKFIISPEDVRNKVHAVEGILSKVSKEDLLIHYEIADFESSGEFLRNVARQRQIMDKGNMPNADKAAKVVVQEWLNGKLAYQASSQ